jgi:putative YphP/YqiW family bacilliredoxin
MKAELTDGGFEEMTSAASVEETLQKPGTTLVVINSVCGCAAGNMRPGVKLSINGEKAPSKLATVFAGVDQEAVAQARKHFLPYPPSSPSIALFKDGELVHFLERHHIEGGTAQMIAENLQEAYNEFC